MRSWSRAEPERRQDLTDVERAVAAVRSVFGPGVLEVAEHEGGDGPAPPSRHVAVPSDVPRRLAG